MNKTWLIALVALVALALLAGGYWVVRNVVLKASKPLSYSITSTPFSALVAGNPDFVTAEARAKSGDAQGALSAYQDALAKAQDSVQIGQIKFKIAYEQKKLGNYSDAIRDLQDLANDDAVTPIMRAYAIQQVGIIWRDQGDSVAGMIFSDQPFRSLAVPTDPDLTLRKIFEAALSFYPKLAVSELYVANWYATQLELASEKSITLSDADKASYLQQVKTHLANADDNLPYLRSDPNMTALYPTALTLKASVEATLAVIGEGPADDAKSSFDQVLAYYQVQSVPTLDGIARYQYARFLQKMYGKQSAADVTTILQPITTTAYANSEVIDMLRNAHVGDNAARMHSILRLAALDPAFKTLLASLGWTAEELKGADTYDQRKAI